MCSYVRRSSHFWKNLALVLHSTATISSRTGTRSQPGVCWLELHHCFSHSIKVRGLLQYVYVGLWEYVLIFKKLFPTSAQWLSQLKNLGGTKMFGFRRITLFCLEKRLSKHKITIFSKHLGGMAPLTPPGYAYASA